VIEKLKNKYCVIPLVILMVLPLLLIGIGASIASSLLFKTRESKGPIDRFFPNQPILGPTGLTANVQMIREFIPNTVQSIPKPVHGSFIGEGVSEGLGGAGTQVVAPFLNPNEQFGIPVPRNF